MIMIMIIYLFIYLFIYLCRMQTLKNSTTTKCDYFDKFQVDVLPDRV